MINPVLVMGPALLEGHKNATSVELMAQIVNKAYPGVPRVQFPVCDVRDVAKAHVKVSVVQELIPHHARYFKGWFRTGHENIKFAGKNKGQIGLYKSLLCLT